ncbi:hypothetical protein BCR42DRAFT_435154 [Absidia repens]|uniref:Ubiquitin carboxyl-terminal hydrolase n=1 Tax=Absidia repens TaxID=90262 RepID=A0A1X2ISS5_9FUNG|nr:hypothetical protein BCR42DRAFT_435154 [Absidia repens]
MWILVALEELGLFGLLDTLFCWLPLASDDNTNQQDDDEAMSTSLFPGAPPNADYAHLKGSQRHHMQQSSLNHQLANVCIRGPENTQEDPLLVSGLVNTGNTCYLNSVLQALSSLPRLQLYLDGVNSQYTSQHLPVTRSLYKTLRLLSRPLVDELNTKNLAFRPVDIVSAVNVNHRVINREQQDAHELFQLLSGALETEGLAATKGCHVDNGLKGLLSPYDPRSSSPGTTTTTTSFRQQEHSTADSFPTSTPPVTTSDQHNMKLQHNNPLTGLLANRLSCTKCGYTQSGTSHSTIFNSLYHKRHPTTLDDCLEQLTAMEHLDDVSCRKCSMDNMVQRMGSEVERLQQQVKLCVSDDNKKREMVSTLVQVEMQRRDLVHQLSVGGSMEDDHLKKGNQAVPYQMQCGQSTKQVMLAKPPKVLCLHISRSTFHPTTGVIYKNKCQLEFPEYLDMDRFCTNGTLLTVPDQPISLQQQANDDNNGSAPSLEKYISSDGVKYKLMSIIVHYGSHSCGHFIAYKRRVIADDCGCEKCGSTSQEDCVLRSSDTWYRISDENVDVCTIDEVLLANPYMLLYESIDPPSPTTPSNNCSNTLASLPTTARVLVSTERNYTVKENDDDEILLRSSTSLSSSSSSSSLSSTSTALSSTSSSSVTNLPTSPSPSNSTDLLAVSPSSSSSTTTTLSSLSSSSSSSSYTSPKHHHQQQHHLGSSHLVHRNKDRRKLDWQESAPPLVIY